MHFFMLFSPLSLFLQRGNALWANKQKPTHSATVRYGKTGVPHLHEILSHFIPNENKKQLSAVLLRNNHFFRT